MLYFIKGDSPKNWGAMKLKLTKGASPSAVIAGMEKDGWKSVTVSAFNAWRKQNSRPTLHALDGAIALDNQQVLPADVLVGEGTLPEPPSH